VTAVLLSRGDDMHSLIGAGGSRSVAVRLLTIMVLAASRGIGPSMNLFPGHVPAATPLTVRPFRARRGSTVQTDAAGDA
jgi:hypothetical protein